MFLGATTLGILTLSITTFSIMTLSMNGLHVKIPINDTQRSNALPIVLSIIMLSVFIYCYAECHCAECRYTKCHYAECGYAECHGAVFLYSLM